MNASAHMAAGTVVAMTSLHLTRSTARRVALAAGTGLLSHVLLDSIPHSDYVFLPRDSFLVVSIVEAMIITAILAPIVRPRLMTGWRWPLVVGVIAAGLPDMKVLLARLLPTERAAAIAQFTDGIHDHFHAPPPSSPYIGLAIEVSCTIAMLWLLTRFPRTAGTTESA